MRLGKHVQITYCTNIHPGQDWETTFDSLKENVPKIKKAVAPDRPFGLGLRLSNKASEELAMGERLRQFQEWLQEQEVYVFTMNGFPYGNFHDERVKDDVHTPDWTTKERLVYTKRLFDQLALLLPKGMEGGISTSPISYRHWHAKGEAMERAFQKGAKHMIEVALHLHRIEQKTGIYMHLDIEPEPDGMLENTAEVVRFFYDYLLPMGRESIASELGMSSIRADDLIKRYLTVCYDVCHFSLAYEEPYDTFQEFAASGIKVGKIQVSAALKILFDGKNNALVWDTLEKFNEPTYLHQVTEVKNGQVITYRDLPEVLQHKGDCKQLRAHFHVPIFLETYGALYSTQDHILKTLDYIKANPVSAHLEIETYTWDVLPYDLKENLAQSIIREMLWLKENMEA
jgi:hypothetical protein